MTITLGYWKIRGLAQPIRYLLAHVGAEFEEVLYEVKLENNDWHGRDKPISTLDFPNLPYLYDGDVRISQSNAILRYLSRKYDLDGNNEAEKIRIDLTVEQVQDYYKGLMTLAYNPATTEDDLNALRAGAAVDNVAALAKFLGSNEFFSGGGLSYADFRAYEWLYLMKLFAPKALDKHTNIQDFMSRIENLPKVKAFIESDRHVPWPFTAPFAKWGNSNSNPELAAA